MFLQSSKRLAISRLMHSIHSRSAVFPYEALERRPAQETYTGWRCTVRYWTFTLCVRTRKRDEGEGSKERKTVVWDEK
jgi:hypothetical protein